MATERYFKKNGFVIKLIRDQGEADEHFVDRGEFVVSQQPKTIEEYELAERISRIYRNYKYDKAIYSKILMEQMELMASKMLEE